MALAKDDFLKRLENYELALSSPELVSRSLTDVAHNEKAKMLRNGLAIIGYTILEDFLKKRIGEVLKQIGNTGVSFISLPEKIQEATTLSAIKGIQARAQTLKRNSLDWLTFIQAETLSIASTNGSSYDLSEYSMGWDKSNVSADDIKKFLGNFKVQGGWSSIGIVSSAINISIITPDQIFRNAAQRRHKAAHDTSADSPITDLRDYTNQARVIGFAFDSLISKSLHYIKTHNQTFLTGSRKTLPSDLKFRLLSEVNSIWKEYPPNRSNAYRTNSDLNILQPLALSRATAQNDILLIKDQSNNIKNWFIPFI